jgi:5'-phosphate synthase pdxT subunit
MVMRVGVLALQGGFAPHARVLRAISIEPVEIRSARDLDPSIEGLVLPGGESTAIRHLLAHDGGALQRALHALHTRGVPMLATCAGLILAAREVRCPGAPSFGWIDVVVARNAYGRQVASEVAHDDGGRRIVLIRAPRILAVGPRVEVLGTRGGEPVLVREGALIGATFHPELSDDRSIHHLAFDRTRAAA